MRINHYGYVVRNIEEAVSTFQELGYHITVEKYYKEEWHQWVCFVADEKDENRIELLEPSGEKAACYNILKKNGPGVYHICYDTPNLDEKIETLREKGFLPISPIRKNHDGERMIFMYHNVIGMIELFER